MTFEHLPSDKEPKHFKENFDKKIYKPKDLNNSFENKGVFHERQENVLDFQRRIISGLAIDTEMRAMATRTLTRKAIEHAGLAGKLGSPQVMDTAEVAVRSNGILEMAKATESGIEVSYIQFTDEDQILAIADSIRALREQPQLEQ